MKPQVRVSYTTLQNIIMYVTHKLKKHEKKNPEKIHLKLLLTMATLGEWKWVVTEFYFLYFCCIWFCFVMIQLFYFYN